MWLYFYDSMLTPLCPCLMAHEFVTFTPLYKVLLGFTAPIFTYFWPQGIRCSKAGIPYFPQLTEKKGRFLPITIILKGGRHTLWTGSVLSWVFTGQRKLSKAWHVSTMKADYEYFALSCCQYIAFKNPHSIYMFSGGHLALPPGRVWHYFHFQICIGLGLRAWQDIIALKAVRLKGNLGRTHRK